MCFAATLARLRHQRKPIRARLVFAFLVMCQSVAAFGCVSDPGERSAEELKAVLLDLTQHTGNWTVDSFGPDRLWQHDSFDAVERAPCEWLGAARALFDENPSKVGEREALVLVNLFRALPLGDFVDLVSRAWKAHEMGRIPVTAVEYFSFPAVTDRPELYLAYQDPNVSRLYNAMAAENSLDEQALSLVSGKSARMLTDYFHGTGMSLPTSTMRDKCP